jgi:hypothetical protein
VSRDDIDQVLDDGVKTAVHFLEKSREFFPFSVIKTREGDVRHINVWDKDEQPNSERVIELLRAVLKASAERNEIMCVAIISDARFKDTTTGLDSDAIRAEIEHARGESINLLLPYWFAGSQVETGEVVGQQGSASIFGTN